MNYVKRKVAENLHVPELVDTVRIRGTDQLTSYSKQFPYLKQTFPATRMSDRKRKKRLNRIGRIAGWLDSAVPSSPIPLGIDSILGFIPLFGGSISSFLSFYVVYQSTTFGIPLWLFMHMLFNIAIDFVFSLIPVFGGFLHMFYKANIYNYEALKGYLETPEYLERVQLREQKSNDDILPGDISWVQLGIDAKNLLPFNSTMNKTSPKKAK